MYAWGSMGLVNLFCFSDNFIKTYCVCVIWQCAVNVCILHSHDFVCISMHKHPKGRRKCQCHSLLFLTFEKMSRWSKHSPSGLGWLFSKLQRSNCVCPLPSILRIPARKAWLPADLNSAFHSCTASAFTPWVISQAPKDLLKIYFKQDGQKKRQGT